MISVYIREKPVYLTDSKAHFDKEIEILDYDIYPDKLSNLIEAFETESTEANAALIYSSNLKKLFSDFCQFYKIIEAAGGLVFNEDNKVLAILRNAIWDLPKGKVEKGESFDAAALREVEEECGLKKIKLIKFLTKTYHTYFDTRKNRSVLKISHWYEMKSKSEQLIPQVEEGIEQAVWIALNELKAKKPIYNNILLILEKWPNYES
jgi:8-oxo-dGTP pyrophosphatase MutT (NUDIX family)